MGTESPRSDTMSKVTLTTELPIPAQMAAALARKPEMMKYLSILIV